MQGVSTQSGGGHQGPLGQRMMRSSLEGSGTGARDRQDGQVVPAEGPALTRVSDLTDHPVSGQTPGYLSGTDSERPGCVQKPGHGWPWEKAEEPEIYPESYGEILKSFQNFK